MLRWIDVIKYARYGNPEPDKRIEKSESEWQETLTPSQFEIARLKGTEPPYRNTYCNSYEPGKYYCICCDSLLFDSYEKYHSMSGWPGFKQPARKNAVKYITDESHGMKRIEALCNVCDCHLGHVFPDGPEPAGLRYCINSESIYRIDENYKMAAFGAGCFWCIEALMQEIPGVFDVEPGYSGGRRFNPTYREVSSGKTGHAEVVRFKYDPDKISYEELMTLFFTVHNPSLINPEDKDHNQYRSIILYFNDEQQLIASKIKEKISKLVEKPVYTEIIEFKAFYPAEENHINYYRSDPSKSYCENIIEPKLIELRKRLKENSKE